jgi:nitroimidazol reductase NimA-like FMN-containing flavoprotein (pyridoxamine 5'-phosphate oxidase superfamily)
MNLTKRTELRRIPDRGSRDWEAIHKILDAGFLSHVGFCVDGQPFVIPTLYGRDGEKLYLHGSAASRMLRELEGGFPACVSVTLVDGLVLARSAFEHSMNYRSVVAFGTARKIADPEQKTRSLRVISEHLIAGRWADVRGRLVESHTTVIIPFNDRVVLACSTVPNPPVGFPKLPRPSTRSPGLSFLAGRQGLGEWWLLGGV